MQEHQCPICRSLDIKLDHVDAQLDSHLQSCQRILRRMPRRTPMCDPKNVSWTISCANHTEGISFSALMPHNLNGVVVTQLTTTPYSQIDGKSGDKALN
jgi:hypothetical protein